ncbi:DUF31 family protein [Mycoplasmoides pneumoniae]
MLVVFKRLGFIVSIFSLTFLSACAAFDKWQEFYINNIPSSTEIHRFNYDLNFSLTFTNRITSNGEAKFSVTYGTGWLIDWKEPDKKKENDPFRAYLATNLQVAASLINPQDYEPYKNKDDAGWTTTFRLGKYTKVSDFVSPNQFGLPNAAQALVNVQTSVIPKTAFAARDFVDYSFPQEQKDKEKRKQQWVKNSHTKNSDVQPFAEFAILEIPLFSKSKVDRKIFNHFIQPAIRTYKQLGDSLNIFANPTLDQLKQNRYYVLGYPFLKNKVSSLFLNQAGKKKGIFRRKYTNIPWKTSYYLN